MVLIVHLYIYYKQIYCYLFLSDVNNLNVFSVLELCPLNVIKADFFNSFKVIILTDKGLRRNYFSNTPMQLPSHVLLNRSALTPGLTFIINDLFQVCHHVQLLQETKPVLNGYIYI
jgi:hypothetical protein